MPFRILEYMVRIWRKYINEQKSSVRESKEFKLPVICPIVFYDGVYQWTAEKSFANKVEKIDQLKKYIPKFEYKMISLNNIKNNELMAMDNPLSLIMLIDKIKDIKEFSNLREIEKEEYWKRVKEYFKDSKLLEIIAESVSLMLKNINVSDEEIARVKDQLYEGRLENMFELAVKYDVQKIQAESMQKGIQQGLERGRQEALQEKLDIALKMLDAGSSIEFVSQVTSLSIDDVRKLQH